MPSPHPAVTPSAILIAKKYGKSVSKGIVAMQKCIETLEKANKEKAALIWMYKHGRDSV